MDVDTQIGGPQSRFPDTRVSAIACTRSPDATIRRRAHGAIVEAYWKPVYKYLRLRKNLGNETAKDLAQGFFALAIEKCFFNSYDPQKGSFRTFLRTCVDAFVANEAKRSGRLKRGGLTHTLSLDFANPASEPSLDEFFHREWVRSVFGLGVEDLRVAYRAKAKHTALRIFESYDLCDSGNRPSYAELAAENGITTVTLTNYLSAARRDFRKAVLNRLRTLTVDDREFRLEARAVLGIEV